MDDIAESYISRFISQLKVRLVEVFEVFNIELALPLLLNSKQCKKLLGIANETEFQRVSHLKDFPRIDKKGSHPRFPRDAVVEWMRKLEVDMTEAILTLGIFAVPILAVAIAEQRKAEKERKCEEFEEIRRRDYLYGFKAGMGYQSTCDIEKARNGLKRDAQQVDKEIARYAEMVG